MSYSIHHIFIVKVIDVYSMNTFEYIKKIIITWILVFMSCRVPLILLVNYEYLIYTHKYI